MPFVILASAERGEAMGSYPSLGPYVQAALLCDHVVQESSGRVTIVGILDRVVVRAVNLLVRRVQYARLDPLGRPFWSPFFARKFTAASDWRSMLRAATKESWLETVGSRLPVIVMRHVSEPRISSH
jgi:hypothetical protein